MDAVPRISRAQSLDVLSSMANIAGYRAVVEAAHAFGRFFTGQVTAAGKVPPAKVLVAGAGVAGLAAIGAARSLGAIVRATDPRPEVAEQVRSLGGEFLAVRPSRRRSADGYAKATSDDYDRRRASSTPSRPPTSTSSSPPRSIPGRPAPKLITAEDVARMKPGSVIVDMAAAQGGNVEGTVAGEGRRHRQRRDDHRLHRPARHGCPAQASQLYGTNLRQPDEAAHPRQGRPARPRLRRRGAAGDDRGPRRREDLAAAAGQVSAAPARRRRRTPSSPGRAGEAAARPARVATTPSSAPGRSPLFLVTAFSPTSSSATSRSSSWSIVIGFYVIGKVHHALHTPLMSVTNAISGIIVVGALLQIGHGNTAVTVLSFAAILLASINIFGGFAVTRRMLGMFSKG